MEKQARKKMTASGLLLALCWMAYTCSLIGKVNYSASITQVEAFFGVSHAEAGMVSTFYFFAYGAGQIINGLLCKKYNIKYMVFGSLFVSGVINLIVGLTNNFAVIKWLWLINGLSLSILWPSLIRLLSETFSKRRMVTASVIIGTTTATGTFITYGLGSLYAALGVFRFSFYTAAVVLPLGALVWLCSFSKLTKKAKVEGEKEDEEDGVVVLQAQSAENAQGKVKMTRTILITVLLLCLFAVATNFIKDGLTTWIPSILKEEYGLPASLSILLTLFLPVLGIFGNLFSNKLYRFFGDFIVVVGVLFLGATALVGGVIASLSLRVAAITLIAFALTYFLAGSSNSTITSVFPLQMKGKINSGLIAGIINGCCYIGSTISSYGLGAVADSWGWSTVFWLLFAVSALVVVIAAVYKMIQVCHRKQEK